MSCSHQAQRFFFFGKRELFVPNVSPAERCTTQCTNRHERQPCPTQVSEHDLRNGDGFDVNPSRDGDYDHSLDHSPNHDEHQDPGSNYGGNDGQTAILVTMNKIEVNIVDIPPK